MRYHLKIRMASFSVWAFLTYTLLDANNILLHAKMYFFIFTLFCLYTTYAFRMPPKIFRFLLFIILWSLFTYGMGRLYDYKVENSFFLSFLFTFTMLFLLGWHRQLKLYEKLWFPCLILSVATIVLYAIVQLDSTVYGIIMAFGENNSGTPTIYISSREFLGYQFHGVFYTPLILCTIPASTYMYRYFSKEKDKTKNLIMSLIFLVSLFCAGNRAGLMACVIIPVIIIMIKIRERHTKIYRLLMCMAIFSISLLTYSLVSDRDDKSNDIKNGHIRTYKHLLIDRPEVFLTGMGPGSLIYSEGFGDKTTLMEWTYLEILRLYGVGGFVIIYFFWFPTCYVWKRKEKYSEAVPFVVGSLVFLLASSTNPYLLNSTGMIFLVMSYAYLYNMRNVFKKRVSDGQRNTICNSSL